MSYLRKSFKGLSWTVALRVGVRLGSIGRTAILARILLPSQFGAFGIAVMAMGLLEIITETGINVFLLQEGDNYLEYVDTAWVVSIFRGALISILIVLTAPFVSTFFSSPEAKNLLYLIALVPLIRAFINPACVRFLKELRFDREFAYRTTILCVELGVSIVAAIVTRSAASFVWGLVASAAVEVVMSFVFITPRPRFHFDLGKIKRVINRGKWVTGFGLFDYVFTQADNVTVGRLLGEGPLGIYRTAYSLSTLPVTEISETFYKVMFPVFVEMGHDKKRLRTAVLKSVSVLMVAMTVAGLAVFVFAEGIVKVVLGPAWVAAIPVIRVLTIAGLFKGLSYSFNALFVAQGRQKYVTTVIFVSMIGLLITIVPAVKMYGTIGAGYSAAFASILAIPVAVFLTIRMLRSL